MKSNRLGLAGALVAGALALSPAAPAWADPILVGPPNAATGINGLAITIGITTTVYDVTFSQTGALTFNTLNDALTAASALESALNGLGVSGLTNGVSNNGFALVPYAGPFGTAAACSPSAPPCFDVVSTQLVGTWQSPSSSLAPTHNPVGGNADYAVFTVEVPGPIVGAGFPGLIAACVSLLVLGRRRKQIAV